MDIDDEGDVYISGESAGWQALPELPTTPGVFQETASSDRDAYILKLADNGTTLEYCTFLGGSAKEYGSDITVDEEGNAHVTGRTTSTDFPVTQDGHDRVMNGPSDVFYSVLDKNGSKLLYSTFIGGSGNEFEGAISLNGQGHAIIVGRTVSTDFSTTPGAYKTTSTSSNPSMGFLTKFNMTSGKRLYSTYIGTDNTQDSCVDVKVDDEDVAYILGSTQNGYPTTRDAVYRTVSGIYYDLFVTLLDMGNSTLDYSTLIGGGHWDYPSSLTFDERGCIHVLGWTKWSFNYPTTDNAYQSVNIGEEDVVYSLLDIHPPEVVLDNTETSGIIGKPFHFNFTIRDGSEVDRAEVEIWRQGQTVHNRHDLELVSGNRKEGTWELLYNIRGNDLEDLNYVLNISDVTGHVIEFPRVIIPINDGHPPEFIGWDETPVTTGDEFDFVVNVTDNRGVFAVSVIYWYGSNAGMAKNVSMTLRHPRGEDGNGTWAYRDVVAPVDSMEPVNFKFFALDVSGLRNMTGNLTREVLDNDPPEVVDDSSARKATTGDPLRFEVKVRDNMGVGSVHVVYWTNTGERGTTNVSLGLVEDLGEGVVRFLHVVEAVPIDTTGSLSYSIHISDIFGNWFSTPPYVLVLSDNDPPEIVSDGSDGQATMGDTFQWNIEVMDHFGIDQVTITYWFDEWTPTMFDMDAVMIDIEGNGTYRYSIDVPLHMDGALNYRFEVTDANYNKLVGDVVRLDVFDDDPPVITELMSPMTAVKGHDVTFEVMATDNMGIADARIVLLVVGGDLVNISMQQGATSYFITLRIPRGSGPKADFHFSAVDAAGNWVMSSIKGLELTNEPPVITDVPMWIVTEGKAAERDMAQYVTDANDAIEDLTLTVDSEHITVEGMTLRALFPHWVDMHRVELVLTDGEDSAYWNMSVEVNDVNDPPSRADIIGAPSEAFDMERGDNVTLDVEYDDPDLVEGKALTITWSSDIIGVLSSQSSTEDASLSLKGLSAGTHVITVEVSDGEYVRSDSIEVTVVTPQDQGSDPQGPSNTLYAAMIIIIVMVILGVMMYLRRSSDT